MKGRYMLVGLLLLLVFTAAVSRTLPQEGPGAGTPASVDLVVVGSGLPALTAALQAVLLGAEVMLLDLPGLGDELPPPLGGRFAAFAPGESPAGRAADRPLLEAIERASPGIDKTRLAELLAEGRDTLEWLSRETGLSFFFPPADPHHSYAPTFQEPDLLPAALRAALLPRLAARVTDGAPLEILTSPQGQVEGLRYRDGEGSIRKVLARAVLLAPGGYLGHRDFMAAHNSQAASLTMRARENGTAGTAYDLTRPFRARLAHPERVLVVPFLYPPQTMVTGDELSLLARGHWFTGEGSEVTSRAAAALAAGTEAFLALLQAEGDLYVVYAAGQDPGLAGLAQAGTLEGLEAFTTLPRDRLQELMARLEPPYRAARLTAEPFYSLGGLATDTRGRVLGPMGPLAGLYALGEASGSLHGQGLYPGLPLTEALVMGRRVGQEAALYSR